MVESLILLLLSSGLYRQTHAAAMTACCALGIRGCGAGTECLFLRGHGEPPGARCPVRSTMRGHARLRSHGTTCRHPPSAIRQWHLLRVPTARQSGTRQLPGGTRPLTAAKPRVCAFRFVVVAWKSGVHRPALSSGSLLRHRHRHRHRRGAARRKQARAANAGQDHRCRTRDGVDRRAPARRRAPGSGVLLKRAASGLSRAGPSAPLPPGAAGRGSPRRAA